MKNKRDNYVITYKQMTELEDELLLLKSQKRVEITKKISVARAYEDDKRLSEVKTEQRTCERRISEIEYLLRHAEIIADEEVACLDTIVLGSQVLLYDKEFNEEVCYSIVDTSEANSLANKISDESPLGKALLGKKVGDIVSVPVGGYISKYEVLNIEGIELGYMPAKNNEKKKNEASKVVEIIDISPKDFITRVHMFRCTNEKHELMDIRCRVNVITGAGKIETCVVPGAYCKTCDKYYLLDAEYKRLKQRGILICKVVEEDFWTSQERQNGYSNLNQESVLHMMGYNVNAQANLSMSQRRGILRVIVEEEILTIAEIRSHLQWLIKRNQNNSNFSGARIKWEEDCAYLAELGIINMPTVNVNSITKKNYHKR